MSLHATSLCFLFFVLLDFLMLFIFVRCKEKKSPLVLFDTPPSLCGEKVGGKMSVSALFYSAHTCSLQAAPQRGAAASHVAITGYVSNFCFLLARRCFIFSANVKSISHAIRVERRTHGFFIEEQRNKHHRFFSFNVIHSMLLQFEEINKRIEI